MMQRRRKNGRRSRTKDIYGGACASADFDETIPTIECSICTWIAMRRVTKDALTDHIDETVRRRPFGGVTMDNHSVEQFGIECDAR